MQWKKSSVLLSAVATAGAALVVASPPAAASPTIAGTYNSVAPSRVVDTRAGTGAPKQTIASGKTLTVKATSQLPTGTSASAVALTVTVVAPAAAGYLIAYPGGSVRPTTSNINFLPGSNTPNSVIVGVPANGTISFYNGSAGPLSLIADLYGYWTGGTGASDTAGAFLPLPPARATDSRSTGNKALAPRSSGSVPIAGRAGVPATGVTAVVANLTAVAPARGGYLTADSVPSSGAPGTSSVNFAQGETRANLVTVPVNPDGTISLRNETPVAVNYLVDIFGYFRDGAPTADGAFVSSNPFRVADTPLAARATLTVPLFPDSSNGTFKAVAVNITAASATGNGWLTPFSGSGTKPITSVSNFKPGQAPRATTVLVPVDANGSIAVYNASNGTVRVIVDVEGFVLNNASTPMAGARAQRRVDSSIRAAKAYAAARQNH